MYLSVEASEKVSGEVVPSPSKFYTQFATAVASLTEEKSVIKSPLLVDDTRGLADGIETMGAEVKRGKERWSIWGSDRYPNPTGQIIDAKKSIVGLSLLTSLSALVPRIMVITGKKQVRSCPVPSLIDALQKLGVDVHSTKSDETPPLVIFESKIKGGEISLSQGMDPRFLPAFLLLTPYGKEGVEFKFNSGFKTPMTDMTLEIMRESGMDVAVTQKKIRVPPRGYEPIEVTPPLDMFTALPFVLGAVITGGEMSISKIGRAKNVDSFLSLLERMGVDLERTDRSIKVPSPQQIGGRRYSLEEFPEIVPFAAVLACSAEGKTRIINAGRARNMKSDRISAICEGLKRMGAQIEVKGDEIIVDGPADLKGAKVDGYGDDAIVAALGTAGLIAKGKTIVRNRAETLRESYPRFVSTFKDLGAEMGYKS